MHGGSVVVGAVRRADPETGTGLERIEAFPGYRDEFVAVVPLVFVPEPDCVADLVDVGRDGPAAWRHADLLLATRHPEVYPALAQVTGPNLR